MTQLRLTESVGTLVRDYPVLATLFERAHIDYCCGGRQTLAEACTQQGIDPQVFLQELEAALETASVSPMEVAHDSLTALIDHIETVHHAYLHQELPHLQTRVAQVVAAHGHKDARLAQLQSCVAALAAELQAHLQKEEQVLFPLLRQLEASNNRALRSLIQALIECMEQEHQKTGAALAQLRGLTADFTPPAWACNTYHALLAGLLRLEQDLHQHIHKENNILFPKAIADL